MLKIKSVLKYILIVSVIIISGLLLLVSIVIFGPSIKSYLAQKDFDSIEWKSNLDGRSNIKQRMLKSLLSEHNLVGMSAYEIEQLLGKPPSTGYFKDYDYVYWLGPERGLGVDSEWLCLKFNQNKVVKADVLKD